MSKAILIFDMPNSCEECSLFCGHYSDMYCKGLNNRSINYPYPKDFRQDWCPLKEIPKRDDNDGLYQLEYTQGYMSGWNACLGEILG